jgi:hypothetical protein
LPAAHGILRRVLQPICCSVAEECHILKWPLLLLTTRMIALMLPMLLLLLMLMLMLLLLLFVPEALQFLCFSHSTAKAAAFQKATTNAPK